MKTSKYCYLLLSLFVLSGCTTTQPNVIASYQAKTISEIYGNTLVEKFDYKLEGDVAPNQIPNTAIGNIYFDTPIGEFYADAMRRELRASGVSLNGNQACLISGSVNDFKIDDLGFEADIYANVSYQLKYQQSVIYENNDNLTELKVFKSGAISSVYQVVALNIKNVLEDENFIRLFEQNCK